ncbi:MAG TPA: group II intron reverse transcriptase/maturase [Candidatus Binatia bacterium]|nr:group II intron reverse transcriptase/maturase [Candidatus Binatia bacterium]
MMNGPGKSDRPTVPVKSPNNTGQPMAEEMEGNGLAKGNLQQQNASRTPSREDALSVLERVRQAAKKDKQLRFTALLHHTYNLETLRRAYYSLKKEAAPGVDWETWRYYGETREENLQDLSHRLKRGAYRAKPVRRVYIPKFDGRQRPLGVTALEDKIVQRATVEVLNAIYETDFLGFSYGFRPGRSQHPALDALYTGLLTRKVSWGLDLDIRGFFDGLSHEWLVKFMEHRIADRRVVRLIQKWLNAGVLEDGKRMRVEEGTPQGGSASPLLANIYLHYVFDLWVQAWRKKRAHGDVIVVRFADDSVLGFQSKADAEQFRVELTERMKKFDLELHPEKTRLLEFGPFVINNQQRRGEGKPETFNFLGFTHICVKKRSNGMFTVLRQTMRKRMQAKLNEVKAELQRRMHEPIPALGKWLQAVVRGHTGYYGVPMNQPALKLFRFQVGRFWHRALSRRSQNGRILWDRMRRLITRWLPMPVVCHPYPLPRLGVIT